MSFTAWAVVVALALAAAAVQAMAGQRSPPPRDAAWAAVFGGGFLVVVLLVFDGGRILRWRYGLGAGADRVELPGAALVLGLALLASLGGTLSMAAHLLAATGSASRARLLGQRLLILGAGLGALGVGVAASQVLSRTARAVAAGASDLAALALAVGLLVLGITRLLATPVAPSGALAEGAAARAARMLRLAAAAALLAAAVAGWEGWWREGSYATATAAEVASAALLGLAAVQPTRLGMARATLFLLGLLSTLARAL